MENTTFLAAPDTLSATQEVASWQQKRTSHQLQSFVERKLQQVANELEFGLETA